MTMITKLNAITREQGVFAYVCGRLTAARHRK